MNTPADKHFLKQVAELGFTCQHGQDGSYIHSPVSPQHWRLHQEGDRWVLYVRNIPQIVFYPDEVLKFLQKQQQIQQRKVLEKP